MPSFVRILSPEAPLNFEVFLPYSKSESNRALIINVLGGRNCNIDNLSTGDDTILMNNLLEEISCARDDSEEKVLDCSNAGTVFRFLSAFLCITPGQWYLTGSERMKQRPVAPLVEVLNYLGASVSYAGKPGFPPLKIAGGSMEGGAAVIDAGISSQFISALMMIAPKMRNGLYLKWKNDPVSFPYIRMTAGLMMQAGVKVDMSNKHISISKSEYQSTSFKISRDWSSASYWYEMLALSGAGKVFFPELSADSLQGDRYCAELFSGLGIVTGSVPGGIIIEKIDVLNILPGFDLRNYPDLVLSYVASLAGTKKTGVVKGIDHLKFKESDRLDDFVTELQKTGFNIIVKNDQIIVNASTIPSMMKFDSYNDHRLVMSFAALSMVCKEVTIANPDSVSKSYPDYFEHLVQAGFVVDFSGR